MPCPHCRSTATTTCKPRTALGYPRFTCQACGRRFNERTGTPFNDLQHPTDIVLLAVLWRLRYKLSFRDVAAPAFPGTSTKPMWRSPDADATCIAPSIARGR